MDLPFRSDQRAFPIIRCRKELFLYLIFLFFNFFKYYLQKKNTLRKIDQRKKQTQEIQHSN